ncbi:hypothetical protein DFLDMN_000369 [Cupriavidus sp. H19C3]
MPCRDSLSRYLVAIPCRDSLSRFLVAIPCRDALSRYLAAVPRARRAMRPHTPFFLTIFGRRSRLAAASVTMPVGRASSHGGAVNLVRSGTKQPQPFSTSAEGQARPPSPFFLAVPDCSSPFLAVPHCSSVRRVRTAPSYGTCLRHHPASPCGSRFRLPCFGFPSASASILRHSRANFRTTSPARRASRAAMTARRSIRRPPLPRRPRCVCPETSAPPLPHSARAARHRPCVPAAAIAICSR